MIPKNIDRQAILDAIEYIDDNGVPKSRLSRTYDVKYNGRYYPPKYVISLANKMTTGKELEPFMFNGGTETNNFLEKLGFEIVPSNIEEARTSDEMKVVTVVIGNQTGDCPDNEKRLSFMKDIIKENSSADIILFPAGYFYFNLQRSIQINKLCDKVSVILKNIGCLGTVCFGIDCDDGIDQLAVAVNQEGIQATGRKFYPTADEKGYIREAKAYNDLEMGYSRVFQVKGKTIFLAVCYDSFGIRHCNLPDLGVDVVLVLAHQFWKQGEGPSGDVDFARKGFAGASQHWNCPVFGTAVFFCRDIPEKWPTGVLWTDQSKSVRHFKYQDNRLTCHQTNRVVGIYEEAVCYNYIVGV